MSPSVPTTMVGLAAMEIRAVCPIDILKTRSSTHSHSTQQHPTDHPVPAASLSSEASSVPTLVETDSDCDSWQESDCGATLIATCLDQLALAETASCDQLWLDERSDVYFPSDPHLPWHFSWVDDGMIGGMSAPVNPLWFLFLYSHKSADTHFSDSRWNVVIGAH